ncbi:helix-turn-helix transcriptional regulator [Streptomyces parvulus]|uniref:helix-turn-helix transcriptional regulator n=1 Tax=Streptomyces parvulus TaxID=146923 RepID=UPI00332685C0
MTEQRTDFTDLVRARRAELGYSLRELESRSVHEGSGTQAKFGWLSKLENGRPVDAPKEELIQALAVGLDIPERILKAAAAAQFFGFDPAGDSSAVWSTDLTTRIIVARAEEMSDEDRAQLAEIAETFARKRTQRNGPGQGKSDD